MQSQKNRTFLGVDAILYPKDTKKQVAPQKKSRRTGFINDNLNVAKDPTLNYQEV